MATRTSVQEPVYWIFGPLNRRQYLVVKCIENTGTLTLKWKTQEHSHSNENDARTVWFHSSKHKNIQCTLNINTDLVWSRPAGQPASHPASQPTGQAASQPARQPASRPGSQPAIQPAGQAASRPSSQPRSTMINFQLSYVTNLLSPSFHILKASNIE